MTPRWYFVGGFSRMIAGCLTKWCRPRAAWRNISEGSGAAATSRKSEMKLTNVARASLSDELVVMMRVS